MQRTLRMYQAFLVLLPSAAIAANLTISTASAAPTGKTVQIVGHQSFTPDVSIVDSQHFQQRVVNVNSGDIVTWKNATDEPHTISVVAPADMPKTIKQVQNCQVCGPFLGGHGPNIGPDGQPTPPFVFFLDNLSPSAGPAKLDSTGDSLIVAPKGAIFPSTTGGTITDTVSALISAPAGTTLKYICSIHPWMQATIRVGDQRGDD